MKRIVNHIVVQDHATVNIAGRDIIYSSEIAKRIANSHEIAEIVAKVEETEETPNNHESLMQTVRERLLQNFPEFPYAIMDYSLGAGGYGSLQFCYPSLGYPSSPAGIVTQACPSLLQ